MIAIVKNALPKGRSKMRIILLSLLAACATDPQPVDPVGTWAVRITYGQGNCGLSGTEQIARGVSESADGRYAISGADPSKAVDVTLACNPDRCRLTFIERDTFTVFTGDWSLDANGAITGFGSTDVSSTQGSCSQAWSVIGLLLR